MFHFVPGLPWAYPGFLGGKRGETPYEDIEKTVRYVVAWVRGAKEVAKKIQCFNFFTFIRNFVFEASTIVFSLVI